MQRSDIRAGIEEVLKTIEAAGLAPRLEDQIDKSRQPRKTSGDSREILTALRAYSLGAAQYSSVARVIATALELDLFDDPSFWAIFQSEGDHSPELWGARRILREVVEFLPRLSGLFEREYDSTTRALAEIPEAERTSDAISFILVEQRGQSSRPDRIADLLLGVDALYTVCADLEHMSPNELTVIACDSGSDISFDLLGAAKVVQCLKQLILDIWDRAVFFKEKKHEERVKSIAESLPVLIRINEGESSGQLSPEQALLMRRVLGDGITKFLASGAITPEMDARAFNNPRVLMAPERKLLGPSPAVVAASSDDSGGEHPAVEGEKDEAPKHRVKKSRRTSQPDDDSPSNALSTDEQAMLDLLLKKQSRKDTSESVS